VAQIAACAAAADPKIGVAADGRPERLCQDAVSQVSLALTLSGCSAGSWADLGVSVRWRLRATGQALAAGRIDVYRAKLIAEATSVLDEETARQVEAKILPVAGGLVAGELRARLRRAVIAADPEGAEQRRRRAERHAKVSLFGDDDGTAVLTGSKLPAIEAAAAMARMPAICGRTLCPWTSAQVVLQTVPPATGDVSGSRMMSGSRTSVPGRCVFLRRALPGRRKMSLVWPGSWG
jgi:hypothetical protein